MFGVALPRPMGDEGRRASRPVGVDAVQAGDPVRAHDAPRTQLAPAYLDHEVGAAGKEPAVGAELGAALDGCGQRGRLAMLEAYPFACGGRAPVPVPPPPSEPAVARATPFSRSVRP